MSRMFKTITSTWNVYTGCYFECSYCNARKAAETRFRHVERYRDGFKPRFNEKELGRHFKPGEFIFVSYMGDIAWANSEWRELILEKVYISQETNFLFQSKNPWIFCTYDWPKLSNIIYGTTIETNRDYRLTKAPPPNERYKYMALLKYSQKFISIEPICDFDLDTLVGWMKDIKPEIIEVGADNYHNDLPEPPWWKVEMLLDILKSICPRVVEKEGLERLKKEVVSNVNGQS